MGRAPEVEGSNVTGTLRVLLARLCSVRPAPNKRSRAMVDYSLDEPPGQAPDPAALARVVGAYQQAHRAWASAPPGEQKEALRAALLQVAAPLWQQLDPVLRPVARRWALSHQLNIPSAESWPGAVDDATTNLCIEIIDELSTLEVDLEQNLVGLFRTIARRREIDFYRRHTRATTLRPPAADPAAAPQRRQQIPFDDALLEQCADQLGHAFEAELIERDYQRQISHQVLDFWRSNLSLPEAHIAAARLLRDPPTPHDEIARALGAPWTSELVRTRLHRLIKRTREHLRTRGLLADDIG